MWWQKVPEDSCFTSICQRIWNYRRRWVVDPWKKKGGSKIFSNLSSEFLLLPLLFSRKNKKIFRKYANQPTGWRKAVHKLSSLSIFILFSFLLTVILINSHVKLCTKILSKQNVPCFPLFFLFVTPPFSPCLQQRRQQKGGCI